MTIVRKEYRIVMPFTVSQYNISQLYTVAKLSKQESTGDSSIEIKENMEYDHAILGKCRKTIKVMNINSKVPYLIRKCVPSRSALKLIETSYNAYPRCNTTYVNGYFSEKTFKITVDSFHKEGNDFVENIMDVPEKLYKSIEIFPLDISKVSSSKKELDFDKDVVITMENGNEVNIGPLKKGWIEKCKELGVPLMTSYKQVMIEVNQFGIGWTAYEIEKLLCDLFLSSHQQMLLEMNEWSRLNIGDIRKIEEETRNELEDLRNKQMENDN